MAKYWACGNGCPRTSRSMALVWIRARSELRSSWRTMTVFALVLGIGGGTALTALAGARRTDTAIGQFVSYSHPDDGAFLFGSPTGSPAVSGPAADSLSLLPIERRIVDLPQVAQYFRAPYLFMTSSRTGYTGQTLNVIGAADTSLFRSVDRPLVVSGKLPDPTRSDEVAINELAAVGGHLHVGSHLLLYSATAAQFQHGALTDNVSYRPTAMKGPTFRFLVTAIVRFPQDIDAVLPLAAKQNVSYEGQQNAYLTPAFLTHYATDLGIPVQHIPSLNFIGVRLRHGAADWNAFAAGVRAIGGREVFTSPGNTYNMRTSAASTQRGVHLEVVALLLFGGIAALVTLLLVGQAIARMVILEGDDYRILRSFGASKMQLIAIVLARVVLIGAAGSAIAVIVATLGSSIMPIGPARQAEIHPGINLDPQVLFLGFVGLVAFVALCALIPAWSVSQPPPVASRPRFEGMRSAGAGPNVPYGWTPLVARIGVQFGLGPGSGTRRVPVVGAILTASLAVAAVVASLTFGASLGHLIESPRQQGWNWNVLVGNPNSSEDLEGQAKALLSHNRFVSGYSAIAILAGASQGTAVIDGKTVDSLLAFDPLKGSVYPPLLEGHAPRTADQVVFASQTLKELHRRVGQSVQVQNPAGRLITIHIVGRMISPSVGDLFNNDMGEGGWVSGAVVKEQQAKGSQQSDAPPTLFTLFAVRYAPGVSHAAALASLRHEFGATVLRQLPSEDVINMQSVDGLPALLAGLVAVLGLATVGNALVSSVRRRGKDLAVLKTLGFFRRQLMFVIAWQATSFSLLALLIGLPLGVVAGRWTWVLVASGIGSVSPPVVPVLSVAIVVPVTLLLANVLAAWPGYEAARTVPSAELRTE
jgi:ABC-type lipoprotein release transport system permease subunit